MTKLKLQSSPSAIKVQESLDKTIISGKADHSRKRGRVNMRWTDSIKEAMTLNLQDLSNALNTKNKFC